MRRILLVTTSKQYPNLDGMSFSLAIDPRESIRLKLHVIGIIYLSDDRFAGRAWQKSLAKESQPFHAIFFELFFRAPFCPSQKAQPLTMLTCDFEATITAFGVHEDILEIV